MFLGANDGLSRLGGAPCCTRRWVSHYAERFRDMFVSMAGLGSGLGSGLAGARKDDK